MDHGVPNGRERRSGFGNFNQVLRVALLALGLYLEWRFHEEITAALRSLFSDDFTQRSRCLQHAKQAKILSLRACDQASEKGQC
jgi:hypothetical protein